MRLSRLAIQISRSEAARCRVELGFYKIKLSMNVPESFAIFDWTVSSTRPAPLSFWKSQDLEANQTGSHTNAVGWNVWKHTSRLTAKCPADAKRVTKFLNQWTGRGKRGSAGDRYTASKPRKLCPQIIILSKGQRRRSSTVRFSDGVLHVIGIFLTFTLCVSCTGTWFNWRRDFKS